MTLGMQHVYPCSEEEEEEERRESSNISSMDSGSKGGCSEEIEVLYMPVC